MSLLQENTEILELMMQQGSDLQASRLVDFSHVFPSFASAEAFASIVSKQGFLTHLEEPNGDEDQWDVTASLALVPTPETITSTEEQLEMLACAHGGRSDGWGFFQN